MTNETLSCLIKYFLQCTYHKGPLKHYFKSLKVLRVSYIQCDKKEKLDFNHNQATIAIKYKWNVCRIKKNGKMTTFID